MFAKQRDRAAIRVPNGIFDWWGIDLGKVFLLLDIIENDGSGSAKQKGSRSTVEYVICLDGRFNDRLDVIIEVSDFDGLSAPLTYEPDGQLQAILTWLALSSTANLFLATKTTPLPGPFFPSALESLTSPALSLGRFASSKSPPSELVVIRTLFSAGLYASVLGWMYADPNLRTDRSPLSAWVLKSCWRTYLSRT